jgi:hypothetical protein
MLFCYQMDEFEADYSAGGGGETEAAVAGIPRSPQPEGIDSETLQDLNDVIQDAIRTNLLPHDALDEEADTVPYVFPFANEAVSRFIHLFSLDKISRSS